MSVGFYLSVGKNVDIGNDKVAEALLYEADVARLGSDQLVEDAYREDSDWCVDRALLMSAANYLSANLKIETYPGRPGACTVSLLVPTEEPGYKPLLRVARTYCRIVLTAMNAKGMHINVSVG